MQLTSRYFDSFFDRIPTALGYRYLFPLGIITFLLLTNRFVYRALRDLEWALESIVSTGIIFSSGVWLLLLPLIHLGSRYGKIGSISPLRFLLYHMIAAIIIGIVQSCLFVYLHLLIWPKILSTDLLNATNLLEDLKLNFFIYWALIGGYYLMNTSRSEKRAFLTIKSNSKQINIPTDHIVMIKALGNYLQIMESSIKGINNHVIRGSMQQIDRQLGSAAFLRVHRSYIVNRDFIKNYQKGLHGEFRLDLNTGETVPTSRTLKARITSWLDSTK